MNGTGSFRRLSHRFGKPIFSESIREIATSLDMSVESVKYHARPKTFTVPIQCGRCGQNFETTEEFPTRYKLDCRYSLSFECDACQARREQQEAESSAAYNAELREKFGALTVRHVLIVATSHTLHLIQRGLNSSKSAEQEGKAVCTFP
jgi:hypothetical protein